MSNFNGAVISVSTGELIAALALWESERRTGQTRSPDELDAMTIGQVALESAEHLWSLLTEV